MEFDLKTGELAALKFSLAMAKGDIDEDPNWEWLENVNEELVNLLSGLWCLYMDSLDEVCELAQVDYGPEEIVEISIISHPQKPSQEMMETFIPIVREYYEIEEF